MIKDARDSMKNTTKLLPSWNMHTEIERENSTKDPSSQGKGQHNGMMSYCLGVGLIRHILGLTMKYVIIA